MSVPASVVNEVKTWLNSQHIKVPFDWVEACVEFLKQENQMQFESGSLQRLKNCVYEQWLAADIQEIAVPCLPSDLSVSQKTTLQGCYALQINGVRDVGKSAYGQLKQLDGTANQNAEVSATPKPFVPEWEAKPTRMLMMNLTDGINYVQGMEYKPISFLSVDLPVGVKVIVQGPVDCRFGVLLLTAEKIRVLGGEVEALICTYSKQEVLREVLQLKNENDEEPVENGLSENQHSVQNNTVQNMRNAPLQSRFHQPMLSGMSSHSSVTPVYPTNPQSHPRVNAESIDQNFESFNNTENLDFDSFENDDDDAFIKSIDYNALEQIEKESIPSVLPGNDDFEISEDEEVYREMMAYQENAEVDIAEYMKTQAAQPKTSSPVSKGVSVSTQNISPSVQIPKSSSLETSPLINQKASFTPSVSPKTSLPVISNLTSSTRSISSSSVNLLKSSTLEASPSVNQKASLTPSISPSVSKQTLPTSSATSSVKHPMLCSSSTASSTISQQITTQGCVEDKPYTCLSSVLQNLDSSSEFTVTIKACINAVLSRLNCSMTSGWQLTVKLDDGTAAIETTVHDKVLEKFIGIPAKDMVVLQMQARSNVEINNKVMEAIVNCKKKLQCLNCLMEVKFSPELSKPCVTKCFL